jgi:hypothetical protein
MVFGTSSRMEQGWKNAAMFSIEVGHACCGQVQRHIDSVFESVTSHIILWCGSRSAAQSAQANIMEYMDCEYNVAVKRGQVAKKEKRESATNVVDIEQVSAQPLALSFGVHLQELPHASFPHETIQENLMIRPASASSTKTAWPIEQLRRKLATDVKQKNLPCVVCACAFSWSWHPVI